MAAKLFRDYIRHAKRQVYQCERQVRSIFAAGAAVGTTEADDVFTKCPGSVAQTRTQH